MPTRAQTSMEFVITYGFMMLIVAVTLAGILVLSSSAKSSIPSSCSIYGTMRCEDVVFGDSNLGGSKLVMLAYLAVPGIVNVSGFNATFSGVNSIIGYCTANGVADGTTSAAQGQSLLCEASFYQQVPLSQTYYGTFNISANYCPSVSANSVCAQSGTYKFAGIWLVSSEHIYSYTPG